MSAEATGLELVRRWFTEVSTIGEMYIGAERECFILEDVYRGDDPAMKVKGRTAIPCGRYRVRKTWSPRFRRMVYEVEDVPGYSGIRIHAGNDADDTEGCLLTGQIRQHDRVEHSVLALQALEAKLDKAQGDIWLTVKIDDPSRLLC